MGSGGSRLLWPPGKLVGRSNVDVLVPRGSSSLGKRTRRCVKVSDPHRLGVIWSSRTGN